MPEDHNNDENIARLIHDGVEEAFTIYYRASRNTFFLFVKSLTKNAEVAEDIVSECFEGVWKLRKNFNSIFEIRSYMYASCKNKSYNYLQYGSGFKNKKEILIEEVKQLDETDFSDSSILLEIIKREYIQQLFTEIKKLPEQRKDVLELFFKKGYTTEEVAHELNLSPQLVRNIKSQAIAQLRKNVNSRELFTILLFLLIQAI